MTSCSETTQLTYLLAGRCAGKAGELIDHGDNTYGGKYVINPSGGLISKGHPLGATGTLITCQLIIVFSLLPGISRKCSCFSLLPDARPVTAKEITFINTR